MVGIVFNDTKLVVLGSLATFSGLLVGALWYKKYLKNKPPSKWTQVGEVSEVWMYPVKSFKGISSSSFDCTPLGLKMDFLSDRCFVVIDGDNKFVTGRDYPMMTQLVATVSGTEVALSCPEFPEVVTIDATQIKGETVKVKIWWTWTEGIDCGDVVASWLSKVILKKESGLRMLYCGPRSFGKKVNDRITAISKMSEVQLQENDGGLFSDGVSFHLVSEASVKELNSRLEGTQVSASNFRPNLVVKGDMLIPFEEDNWTWVKIGNVVFQCLAPCTRCLFTTVDPNTGEKSEKMEPLASLKKYRYVRDSEKRKILTSPAMGIYMGLREPGIVSVGDPVFIPQQ